MGVPRMTVRIGGLFVMALILSIGLDVIWFVYFARHWWNTNYVDDHSLNGLRVWTIIAVIVLWAVKVKMAHVGSPCRARLLEFEIPAD